MKIHKMKQLSPKWFKIRECKLSASHAQTIMANGKGLETYVNKLVAEKYLGKVEGYMSIDMERGIELEDQARMTYEIEKNKEVDEIGFIELNKYAGCSPDGLVNKNGGVEIKCVNDVNFLKIMNGGIKSINKGYICQCKMSLFITKRKWWDLVFYNVNFDKNILIFRIKPDLLSTEKIILGITKGKKLIKNLTKKYERKNDKNSMV